MKNWAFVILCTVGCNATTGSGLVSFLARAGGPANATAPLVCANPPVKGQQLTLTRAQFHLGAIYLNMSTPSSGGPEQPCTMPGIYVAQVLGSCDAQTGCGLELNDLLSPDLTPFAIAGQGTANRAVEAELWLTSGDVNAPSDPTPVLVVEGVATSTNDSQSWPFKAQVTIQTQNRPPTTGTVPATPGANPICGQRIVSRIPIDVQVGNGGPLDLRIDPCGMFQGVDFSALGALPSGTTQFVIPDDNTTAVGRGLFKGTSANSGVYQFFWANKPINGG